MNDYPVRTGSMLYTLVDPNKGHEVAYNRWYERDHFYAGCLIGPWLFAGKRWVATRELKDIRFPEDSTVTSPVDKGSYLATYWVLEGKHDEHFKWAAEQVWELYANDRGFPNANTHIPSCSTPHGHTTETKTMYPSNSPSTTHIKDSQMYSLTEQTTPAKKTSTSSFPQHSFHHFSPKAHQSHHA
ncbi:MAG: hypothetical protein CM15mP49_15410 [Actinomycetota bacterium]|nr:MAG: hypothetical protein CM15mP49_15410 [Actinomycetota bacterium]